MSRKPSLGLPYQQLVSNVTKTGVARKMTAASSGYGKTSKPKAASSGYGQKSTAKKDDAALPSSAHINDLKWKGRPNQN